MSLCLLSVMLLNAECHYAQCRGENPTNTFPSICWIFTTRLSSKTLSIATASMTTLGILKPITKTLSIMTLSIARIKFDTNTDIQHNDTLAVLSVAFS